MNNSLQRRGSNRIGKAAPAARGILPASRPKPAQPRALRYRD